jgi:hypothetical protein
MPTSSTDAKTNIAKSPLIHSSPTLLSYTTSNGGNMVVAPKSHERGADTSIEGGCKRAKTSRSSIAGIQADDLCLAIGAVEEERHEHGVDELEELLLAPSREKEGAIEADGPSFIFKFMQCCPRLSIPVDDSDTDDENADGNGTESDEVVDDELAYRMVNRYRQGARVTSQLSKLIPYIQTILLGVCLIGTLVVVRRVTAPPTPPPTPPPAPPGYSTRHPNVGIRCAKSEFIGDLALGGHVTPEDCLASVLAQTRSSESRLNYAVWRGDTTGGCYICDLAGGTRNHTWNENKGVISFVRHVGAPSTACQKKADDFCTADIDCQSALVSQGCPGAYYARRDVCDPNARSDPTCKNRNKAWRCYDQSALAPDANHSHWVSGSCYCTRDSNITNLLATCLATQGGPANGWTAI